MTTSTNGLTNNTTFSSISESVRSLVENNESFKALKNRVADAGGEAAAALKYRLLDAKDVALDRGATLVSNSTRLAKAHPVATAGIALGVGLLALRLLRR